MKQWFKEFDDPKIANKASLLRWMVTITLYLIPLVLIHEYRRARDNRVLSRPAVLAGIAAMALVSLFYYLSLPISAPLFAVYARQECRHYFHWRD